MYLYFFFFNDTATTEIYTLSLHDALPICGQHKKKRNKVNYIHAAFDHLLSVETQYHVPNQNDFLTLFWEWAELHEKSRSEEHTSELQSRQYLVCRLLLEKKKK